MKVINVARKYIPLSADSLPIRQNEEDWRSMRVCVPNRPACIIMAAGKRWKYPDNSAPGTPFVAKNWPALVHGRP